MLIFMVRTKMMINLITIVGKNQHRGTGRQVFKIGEQLIFRLENYFFCK
ncbi:MAG: hypothetical protein MI740_18935 [Halanaerobiales bacterium]|nr:hypothetical protein [Halanaerobiales bacterium]